MTEILLRDSQEKKMEKKEMEVEISNTRQNKY